MNMKNTKKYRLLILLKNAMEGIDNEIKKHNAHFKDAVGTLKQLNWLKENINQMTNNIKNDTLPPNEKRSLGLWHIIIDSWPMENSLGELILEAESMYDKY
jgi:hypothetical protein